MLSRLSRSGTSAFRRTAGNILSGCITCPTVYCRSRMRFAASIRPMVKACHRPPCSHDCCGPPWKGAAPEANPIAAAQAAFMSDVKIHCSNPPWNMSTSVDLAFPEARGERPGNFEDSRRFEAKLIRAAVADPTVHRALIEVGQLFAASHTSPRSAHEGED